MTNITTIDQVQARLDAMPSRMSAKGLREPEANFTMSANGAPYVVVRHKKADGRYSGDCHYEFIRADTAAECLDKADAWIDKLPSIEETRRAEFTTQLAKTIELGKAAGIEVEFVNPLVETMKRLSANALTFREAA